ncbi:helix-turn-helix domain-containing protein [Paenibacillus agricola]|uniref:Helix-turn-helix domain-containing protein n=1 Tax=Paenibacillus agricola TaxID=2716264 RepID=A0ABX0JKP0_9BACL|nr:helix-turn-helix domain-containing protein [Paenibacillus agricola]NHN35199.1 helix-turn-helix domain-containing protein [Paenibacillus agricola]
MHKVIIVDDESMIKRSLSILIERSGLPFTVVGTAKNGMEASQLIQKLSPELVFTDINMPVMDGLELIEWAESNTPQTTFIIVSGYSEFEYARSALRFKQVVDYLLKPIDPDIVLSLLQTIEQKFERKKHGNNNNSEWIWACTMLGEELLNKIWFLDQASVDQTLDTIDKELTEKYASYFPLLHCYTDLLIFIRNNLLRKDDGDISLAELDLSMNSHTNPRGQFSENINRLMKEIKRNRNQAYRKYIRAAVTFIESHYHEDTLSLQQTADEVGVSISYLSRCFKEETGISFIHYVTQVRIEHAKRMLANPESKTYEVAYLSGYKEYSHFAKVFKKYSGYNPTEYRKLLGLE